MLRRFSINFALLSMALDALTVAFCLWLATVIRPSLNRFEMFVDIPAPVCLPPALYILFPLIWLTIFLSFSIYDGRKHLRALDEFSALSLALLIASVSAAGILYFSYRQVSRALFLLFAILVYLLCSSWRMMMRVYFRAQPPAQPWNRRIVVVGAGSLGQKVRDQLRASEQPGLSFHGFVDDLDANNNPPLLGTLDDIRAVFKEYAITDVVIALPHSAYHQMGEIVRRLEDQPVRVWVALGFFDLALYKTDIEDFAGIPMLDLRASAMDDYQRMVKRAFDVTLGSFALLLALPLLALSALTVYLDDGLPVLFKQTRVGENGRLFEMLKFRTMLRDAEKLQGQVMTRDVDGNLIHKSKDDPRVTRTGKFLRRFSLDELPQLFNILRGEMSLVGPRPELPALVEKYQPWQRKRFAVPPGITGWWQVNGRSDRPMHLHTEDDLYYITNYSLWLDILIITRTVWVVIFGRGAY